MKIILNNNPVLLWKETLKEARAQCSVKLETQLENYLICLLMRFTNQPQIFEKVLATSFLQALHSSSRLQNLLLQEVGDHCLILSGLFPQTAERRCLNLGYFINLGRSAYANINSNPAGIFQTLAIHFVLLMDVLQSIRPLKLLSPLQAYDQWQEFGSRRAFQMLQMMTPAIPLKLK
jgi:hypothetical protein